MPAIEIISHILGVIVVGSLCFWLGLAFRLWQMMNTKPTVREGLRLPTPTDVPVSIIIPAHNEERVIDRCASSLRNQSYTNIQIIFVLDRCTDSTLEILQKDPQKEWSSRKKMYDDINAKYKRAFERQLQIATYSCSVELSKNNCLNGMASLSRASESQTMRMKAWGEVIIDKYNTFIKDDFNVSIRFDLPSEKLVDYFSSKDNRVEATQNAVIAEKLKKRTLNNSSGLRAVCDLEGMRSKLCAQAFKEFIKFISDHRDYRVREPWTNVMFIDGTKLTRVNFALNSSARDTYLYIDARSGRKELQDYLNRFKK